MNKTKIDWCDYTINPVKGLCPMACPYCYARRMYHRFKWNPEIRFEKDVMDGTYLIQHQPDRKRIFVGSTMELFGPWVKDEWLKYIFSRVITEHWNTFIFLTKQPQNLARWSPFPENCWVGVSATNESMVLHATNYLFEHKVAVTQFLSIEPLLSWDTSKFKYPFADSISHKDLDQIIIGAQTGPGAVKPRLEWIQEITEAADKACIPVFYKDNLLRLFPELPKRQEFPKGGHHV